MRCYPVRSFGLLAVFALAQSCLAGPINVQFVSALIEGVGPQPLPVYLAGNPNNVRLRFAVPYASSILSLNSIDVSVDVYDDDPGDNNNEQGSLVFVFQNIIRPNLVLQNFGTGLNAYTASSPLTVTGSVSGADLSDALAEIQDDGFFLIRVNRNAGDFYVKSGSVMIDAETPEPATFAVASLALGAGYLVRLRRRRKKLG